MSRPFVFLLITLATPPRLSAADPVVLEQVVSRHDPRFDVARARLGAGRDGLVYLVSGGYVHRVAADGAAPAGGPVGYAAQAVAANAAGVVVTAEGHFSHRVAVWDGSFAEVGTVPDFLVNDQVQWNAPSDVAAGESGDFYGIDQHRTRVVRVSPAGRLVTTYPLDRLGAASRGGAVGLRVDEAAKRFVTAWPDGVIRVCGFDGSPAWRVKLKPAGEPPGGFDLAPDGRLYVLANGAAVKMFAADGAPAGEVALKAPPAAPGVIDLRVRGGELLVKRSDPATLFEVYDRATGALVRRVPADVERLTAAFPSATWTAGVPLPFRIGFDPGPRPAKPRFRVWWRPVGVPEWAELPVPDGSLTPPAGARGLYQVRVTPDVRGRAAEYTVDGFVEVRAPGAVGSVSVFTPLNRFSYTRGEPIPVTVVVRSPKGGPRVAVLPLQVKEAGRTVLELNVPVATDRVTYTLTGDESRTLTPGGYVITADVPNFTVAPQHVEIGPGLRTKPAFRVVQHGDYSHGFPAGRPADLPDAVADHVRRAGRLGIDLFVDRLGHGGGGLLGTYRPNPVDPKLVDRLTADPAAVAPEKAVLEDAARRTVAAYGAAGIEEQGILLYMDAGLPVGTGFDSRKPGQMEKDLQEVTKAFLPYPAFRGWSWAANWWIEKHEADAAATPAEKAEKAECLAALKTAKETGAWSPVLDRVSDRSLGLAAAADARFRAALHAVAPGKVGAMTGPYRAVHEHPPAAFENADEIDLHYQAEQIQPPGVTPHHVDFYTRPGKPAWGHPELWNDDGTGGMLLPTLFTMAMRGVGGVGRSGPVVPGWGGPGPHRSDARSGAAGTTSVTRAAYALLRRAADVQAGSANADRVAIVVSARMQRIETWDGKIGGAYFDSLYEAYSACLRAHRPASFVFAEDVTPETFARFKAVLVVGQRVELDPPLAAALAAAEGVTVFADGGCRPEVAKEFAPLGVTFDRVKQDPSAWQDDSAYYRLPRVFAEHAAALKRVLGPVVPPVAGCDRDGVLLSERRRGGVRFVWAVNDTFMPWEPGQMWRVSLLLAHRVPVVAKLALGVRAGHTVFDVFAGEVVPHANGEVTADLRTLPARLYAVIPPGEKPPAGEPVAWGPRLRDVAVSADGTTALLNAFNWDHNLYAVDLATGDTRWRGTVGHSFAFAPAAVPGGFVAQGFDLATAEGYHLYHVAADGTPRRRFALYGLPKRATNWASSEQLQEVGINSFAASPDGSWVASAGDLGLVVWDKDGKERWSDDWWKTTRKTVRLLAADATTLVVLDGATATARAAADGKTLWSLKLADAGELLGGAVGGGTLVLRADTRGGRLFVVRGGKLVNTIFAAADDASASADGAVIAATAGRQLKVFDPLGGLLWTYTGDDTLRHPRVSPDGTRVACGGESGTLTVLGRDGGVQAERDMGGLPVPAWLPGGDLLVATWLGNVYRFGPDLREKWSRTLVPTETDAGAKLLAADLTPTTRKTGWGNATRTPLAAPNLLAGRKVLLTAGYDPPAHGDPRPWDNKVELLTDGKPDAPPRPWLAWTDVNYLDSGWKGKLAIRVDTFRTLFRVSGVTLTEDPAHPESWLRDVRLQWWDAAGGRWRDGPRLLSDVAVHSHSFEPVTAAKFRLVSPGGGSWPAGNVRFGELAFHGEVLGPSHPDAAAKRPVAVLFDEIEDDLNSLKYPGRPFGFRYTGAFRGGKCLELSAAGQTGPSWAPPFGHAVPNWDFPVAENPKPGEYRYLRFAWKAGGPGTTGVSLLAGQDLGGGVAVTVGDAKWREGVLTEFKVPGKPPADWNEVTVDLWAVSKGKFTRVNALSLLSTGGGALFDAIRLGRTERDLAP